MSDSDLICNFRKCRKRLGTYAWVTSCSHIFCDEDGTREFSKSYSCPACETNLSAKCEVIRIDLQPGEQYKSMVLAGQKPENIMEICSRALSFWMYQTQQERTYQEFIATKAKDRTVQLENYYEQVLTRTKTDLISARSQVTNIKKELEDIKKKYNELSQQFTEKGRQYQKLQTLYDKLRRKCIDPAMLESNSETSLQPRPQSSSALYGGDADRELARRGTAERSFQIHTDEERSHSPQREFVLRPQHTPVGPGSGPTLSASAIHNRFNMELGTPGNTGVAMPRYHHNKT